MTDIAQTGASVSAAQRHAQSVISEVGAAHVHEDTRWLAETSATNIVRNLCSRFRNEFGVDMEPYYVAVPMTPPGKLRPREVYIPTMPIHEMVPSSRYVFF